MIKKLTETYKNVTIVSQPYMLCKYRWSTGTFYLEVPGVGVIDLYHKFDYGKNLTLEQAHIYNIGCAKKYIDIKLNHIK